MVIPKVRPPGTTFEKSLGLNDIRQIQTALHICNNPSDLKIDGDLKERYRVFILDRFRSSVKNEDLTPGLFSVFFPVKRRLRKYKRKMLTRRMPLTGWGCGGARKIIRLFELPFARS